jgi:hypothetical protein
MQYYILFGNKCLSKIYLSSLETVVYMNFIHNCSQNLQLITLF